MLDILSAKIDKERSYNKMRWGKEVIYDEELSARNCLIVANEHGKENRAAYNYLHRTHSDWVDDVMITL